MFSELKPTEEEIIEYLVNMLKHSSSVEYYKDKIGIKTSDTQSPHDLAGDGNKLNWPILRGLAIENRSNDPEFFNEIVRPAIEYHRQMQHHHKKWDWPNAGANENDLKAGAVNSICKIIEDCNYTLDPQTFEDSMEFVKRISPHQYVWMWRMYHEIERISPPEVKSIILMDRDDEDGIEDKITLTDSAIYIPNIGIHKEIHKRMIAFTKDAIEMLRKFGYHDIAPQLSRYSPQNRTPRMNGIEGGRMLIMDESITNGSYTKVIADSTVQHR